MKVTSNIIFTIDRLPKGYVFTYKDFIGEVNKKEAVIKALNRLVQSGKICKLSKGKFYKPETTDFGLLQPKQEQIVKDLLENDGKKIGYLTGYSIYNMLGLTTQVSNTIQIGKNELRSSIKRGIYKIAFIKQKNIITEENIPLLQILDSIRFIKKIPDSDLRTSCKRLKDIINQLFEKQIQTLVRLAFKYPPSTRALLGAILDETWKNEYTQSLRKSLNPITNYNYPNLNDVLSKSAEWNIR
ncbi:MAG: hypothetical protein A2X64_05170 [Ignavibacteria bacterium GWF2_33_9]|nr:MAG: hypothetical protein A2X64_05170 [Ignavibacteria bacterium GWF2_33_9]